MKSKSLLKKINAFVLAGGRGKRFTPRKSLIRVGNVSIIERTINILSDIFKDVAIISNNNHLYSNLKIRRLPDIIEGAGPKGGIFTGLSCTDTTWNFFVACDMPFISKIPILKMSDFISDDYDCIIPFINNYYEPLFAFYKRTSIAVFKQSLDTEDYKIQNVFDRLKMRKITKNNFGNIADLESLFTNINTKSDLIKLRKSGF